MEPKEPTIKPFRFEDPRQERIYQKLLRLISPGQAAFYRDACRHMTEVPPFETTTHQVAHLLREVESALRDVLESVIERTERLKKKGRPGEEKHQAEILAILRGLDIPETDLVAQAWLKMPGRGNSYGFHARAHRDALGRPRGVDEEFKKFWDDMSSILDAILDKFETRYLTIFKFLDELLTKSTPSADDVKQLRNHVPNNQVTLSYFFDRLPSPAWLEPLQTEGFFRHPPELDRDYEKGTIGFPFWPESRCLARMAARAPKMVLEIIVQIPDTDNVRVHEDLADAALAMPAEMAAEWAKKEAKWVEKQESLFFLLPEKLGVLVGHLARGGQVKAALDLARSLLAVLPDSRAADRTREKEVYRLQPEPRARFDTWDYEEILHKNIPDLVTAAGEDTLALLCDLLDSAIRLSRSHEENEGPEDYSYSWRPAIEDHEQNHPYGLRDFLIEAVWDVAEQIAGTEPSRVPALVEKLEQRPWCIFHRIALHLLRVCPDAASSLIVERLTDRARFDKPSLWHEYVLLLQDHFPHLSPDNQKKILDWIATGPDIEGFKVGQEEETDKRLMDEEAEQYAKYWRLRHLAPLRDVLPPEWGQHYNEWVAELGEPEHPDFFSYSPGVSWGPTSPKGAEDLRSMSFQDIVAFLQTWRQPSGDPTEPSPEGLGRELATVVASEPERFAGHAGRFQELDPTYVRWFLSGLRDAVKEKRAFPWRPVLELCQWVMKQPREIPGRRGEYTDLDPGWVWTRGAIADLLYTGFGVEDDLADIPFDLRDLAWEVLKPITDDPDPTPDFGGQNMDLATQSIKTTRGKAMHAVMRYALWVRRHIENEPNGKERMARGFDEMPEVREVLDTHLDPGQDRALAIRAVYGQWFPSLVLLDREWAAAHVSKIFPSDESLRDLRAAAWETYLFFRAPYDSVFEVLREEYSRAVERIGTGDTQRRHMADPEERLAEHLMVLYWRGKLSLDEPDSLLARFYAKASDKLCGHAFSVRGRRLYHAQENTVPPEILDRLRILWEQRLDAARSATPLSHAVELAAFGWWFTSRKFDDVWAMAQLTEVLRLIGKVDADRRVVERLAALAVDMPQQVVECLHLMVEGDKEGWAIYGWREHARTILATAIQSYNAEACEAATTLVHRLGARGYLEFRDLLGGGS